MAINLTSLTAGLQAGQQAIHLQNVASAMGVTYSPTSINHTHVLTTTMPLAQYQQALNQQGSGQYQTVAINGGYAAGSIYGVASTGVGLGSGGPTFAPQGQYNGYILPQPTGSIFTIAFTDAGGVVHYIAIDQAFVPILNQIEMTYGNRPIQYTPMAPVHHNMLDGDFSLDELGIAEQLIEELSGDALCTESAAEV